MKLMTVEAARAAMLASLSPGPAETVALAEAAGRVLLEPVTARRDQPPFRASAMDGWAVRQADAADAEAHLAIVGESAAGHGYAKPLLPGQAVRIFTGAPVPEGADLVVIQEEAERIGDKVRLGPLAGASANIRAQGSDFPQGQPLVAAGQALDPWRLALCAAGGWETLRVARRPRMLILSTGEELVPPGQAPGPFQIFNSNGPGLSALAARWGATTVTASAGDTEAAILAALDGAEVDLIATVGGASVGDHDIVKPTLQRLGLEIAVASVAMRPGKPTWFGALGDGRKVLGLPGNPASAFVAAELFLKPLLAAWMGMDPTVTLLAARATAPLAANGPREHWMRAKLGWDADGRLAATPFREQDSAMVSVLAEADALLRRPAGAPAVEVGGVVEVLKLDRS